MKTKVLLINAPTIRTRTVSSDNYFPIGILYLATVLKNNGIEVRILDINNLFYLKELNEAVLRGYLEGDFSSYLRDYRPDIVGIGCTFSGAFKSLKMAAEKIKEIFPQIPIVIGGIHPTVFAKEILEKYGFIDYVVMGEGENSFLELVKVLPVKNPPESIDGITFRVNGEIRLNPKIRFENNLDALSLVDYSLLCLDEYKMDTTNWYSPKKIKIGQPFTIISSRSCPNRCNFCSMWLVHGLKFRFRSAANVLDEMGSLYKNYNVRYFQFMDDNITFDKKRILEICRGIKKRNMDIQFDTPNGLAIGKLDQEIIDAMVDAGLVYTSLGIESGSEYIRNKIMRKGLSTQKIYEVINACLKHDRLFIKGFFIIGMPQETKGTLEETYRMIKELPLDKINVNFVAPYPGTDLFNYCLKHNLLRYALQEYADIEVFQDSDTYPHFKPHELQMEDLIEFREKCFAYLKGRRSGASVPENYPLRYRGLV